MNREALPLTFRHWAGVSPYTSAFALAETCVFGKQFRGLFSCGPLAPFWDFSWKKSPNEKNLVQLENPAHVRVFSQFKIIFVEMTRFPVKIVLSQQKI